MEGFLLIHSVVSSIHYYTINTILLLKHFEIVRPFLRKPFVHTSAPKVINPKHNFKNFTLHNQIVQTKFVQNTC